jgi:glycosyltransferase involved in cell wall biosynthesis
VNLQNRPMFKSILHITPAVFGSQGVFGGAERYVHSVARAIEAASSGQYRQAILGFTAGEASETIDCNIKVVVASTDSFAPSRMDWYGRALWQVIPGYEIIHVHQAFVRCGEVALIAAAQLGKICVATDLGGQLPPENLSDHPVVFADRILAISEFSKKLLGAHVPAPVDVVMGPVGEAFFDPVQGNTKKAGVLYVGRILPHKGIDRLIRAAPASLPVTIAGTNLDNEYRAHLEGLAKGKTVTFVETPPDDELPSLYAGAAIHVAPSVHVDYRGRYFANSELMGITTMEALASGTAVAVSNTGSLPSLIGDAPVGECFHDEGELRSILDRVSDGRWTGQFKPETCRAFAQEQYAPAAVGRRLIGVYQAAVAGRSGQ